MADIANLQFRAETGEIKSAYGDLDRLASGARKVESAADGAREAIRRMGSGGGGNGIKQTAADVEALLNKLNPTSKAFDELDESMRQLTQARNSKLIGAEQFSDFSAIIDKQRTALQRSYDDLTGYSDRVKQTEQAERQAAAARASTVASLDRLRGVLNPAAEAAKKLQDQLSVLTQARLNGDLSSSEYVKLKSQLTDLSKAAKDSAVSAGQLQAGWGNATQQFIDLGVQLQGGANPLTALIQQGPQLASSFGSFGNTFEVLKQQISEVAKNFGFSADSIEDQASGINESVGEISESLNNTVEAASNVSVGLARFITPLTVGVAAIVAGIAYLGYQAYKSATQMDTLQKSINSTGNYAGVTARQLSDLADGLADIGDGGRDAAVQATAIAATFSQSAEQIRLFSSAALTVADSTGEAVDEILGQFKRLASDPVQALITLNDQYNFANVALYDQVKALTDAGDKAGAMALIVSELEKNTKQLGETTQTSISNSTGFWDNLSFSIKSAWQRLKEYNAENSKTAYKGVGGAGSNGFSDKYDPYGVKKQADETKNSWDNLNATIGNTLGFVQKTSVATKQFNKESIAATAQIDALVKSSRSNAQIRNDETAKYNKLLKEGKITQDQFNKAVDALNEKYKDPKVRKAKEATVKVDTGDKLTEQYQAQNLALDAQIQALKNRSAFEQNASTQRKAYLELEAKYTVLEQAATTRKLTKQEQQTLAVKDEALAQARLLADKGDQLLSLQKQAQVQDEISKLSATQTLSAEVYAQHQGESTKQMQRQLELAQARAAVLAKGGTQSQADQVVALKQVDYATEDARAQDYINGMKTGLADWAESAQNYAQIAADAVQSGMKSASSAVSDFLTTGKFGFADFAKSILKNIADIVAQLLVLNTLKAGASSLGFGSLFANANGGVYNDPSLHSYANGVYTTPQMFQFSGRSQFANGGVFAEAGPEAIMPLSRDANGRLGVKAEGGGGTGIVINQSNTVQANGSGTSETSSTGGAVGRALGDQMQAAAQQVLQTALKPGGILFRYSNNR